MTVQKFTRELASVIESAGKLACAVKADAVLVLLDSELCGDLFLFFGEQVLGVRFRIQLCLKTTRNQLGRDQPYSFMFLVVVSR